VVVGDTHQVPRRNLGKEKIPYVAGEEDVDRVAQQFLCERTAIPEVQSPDVKSGLPVPCEEGGFSGEPIFGLVYGLLARINDLPQPEINTGEGRGGPIKGWVAIALGPADPVCMAGYIYGWSP